MKKKNNQYDEVFSHTMVCTTTRGQCNSAHINNNISHYTVLSIKHNTWQARVKRRGSSVYISTRQQTRTPVSTYYFILIESF